MQAITWQSNLSENVRHIKRIVTSTLKDNELMVMNLCESDKALLKAMQSDEKRKNVMASWL